VFISLCGPKRVNICKLCVGAMGRGERGGDGTCDEEEDTSYISCEWGCMGVP